MTEAAREGDHREMLVAIRARIAQTVEASDCNAVALAALSRQLVLISRELEVIDARLRTITLLLLRLFRMRRGTAPPRS